MRSWGQHIRQLFSQPHRSDWKTSPKALGHGDRIRQKTLRGMSRFQNPFIALETACPIVTALHRIHEEINPLIPGQLSQPSQILYLGGNDSPFALDTLNHHRHGLGPDSFFHRRQIVVRHINKPGHRGSKALP